MSAARWLETEGITVRVDGSDLVLEYPAHLEAERVAKAVNYAREHKQDLLRELGRDAADLQLQLMADYPHLAPCPRAGGHWLYRGQACPLCQTRPGCEAWPPGLTFSSTLPIGIVPRVWGGVLQ